MAAHSAAAAPLPAIRSVVAAIELDVDPAGSEGRGADSGGERRGRQAEPRPDQDAHRNLRRDDATAARGDKERRPDRPVANLVRDRHGSEQGGEERTEELPPAEHRQLIVAAGQVLGGKQAVQEHGE